MMKFKMITLKNIKDLAGATETQTIESETDQVIEGEGKLTLIPALTDCHVHFRTPGFEEKEDWKTGAKAAVAGGIGTVFEIPNTKPTTTTAKALKEKKELITKQLAEVGIPLNWHLFFGLSDATVEEIPHVRNEVIGLKVDMGAQSRKTLDRAFQLAAQHEMIVAIHAEDHELIDQLKEEFAGTKDPHDHSRIRNRQAAIRATEEALELAQKYSTELYLSHVSTQEELALIQEAKRAQMLVYTEVTPHHLFLTEDDYEQLGNKAVMNPPLRRKEDQEALWEAIQNDLIDTIASDHAPHTLGEKNLPYGQAPTGVPGIETTLPLLLNAVNEGKITLEQIVDMMVFNVQNIFRIKHNQDYVLVDLDLVKTVEDQNLKTKCGWSPFSGRVLKGWPVYTILGGQVFPC